MCQGDRDPLLSRNKEILDCLLPRESRSKAQDAALLLTKGFPAFVVESPALCQQMEDQLNTELLGEGGYRRFVGDEGAEWPFILLFQIITCIFTSSPRQLARYRSVLSPLLYESGGYPAVPQYCSKGVPLREAPVCVSQALLVLAGLLEAGLVLPQELDRRRGSRAPHSSPPVVQVTLLAESVPFQTHLSTYCIPTQTPAQIASVYIWPSSKLVDLLHHHGSDAGLGLTGRPKRPLGSLCTSRVWKVAGRTVMCIPLYQVGSVLPTLHTLYTLYISTPSTSPFQDKQDFYISKDERYVAKAIKAHLLFLRQHWGEAERPTFCILLTQPLFHKNSRSLVRLLHTLRSGRYKEVVLKTGRLQELIPVAKKVEIVLNSSLHIDFQTNRVLASPVPSRRSPSLKSRDSERSEVVRTSPASPASPADNSYMAMYSRVKDLGETDLLQQTMSVLIIG